MGRFWGRSVGLALVCALAVACSSEAPAPAPTSGVGSSSSAPSLFEQALTDYDWRVRAAAAAGQRGDATGWAAADVDALLDADRYAARYAQVSGVPGPVAPSDYFAKRQFGTVDEAYPRFLMGTYQARTFLSRSSAPASSSPSNPATAPDPNRLESVRDYLTVLEQASPSSPWLASLSLHVFVAELPTGPSGPATSDEQRRAATALAGPLLSWVRTGTPPVELDLSVSVAALRRLLLEKSDPVDHVELSCDLYQPVDPASGQSRSVRVARVGAGSLVTMSLRCSKTFVAVSGQTIGWTGPDAQLFGSAEATTLTRPFVMGVLVSMPDVGRASALSFSASYVLPVDPHA